MGIPSVPLGPPFDIPAFTISGALPPYLGATPIEAALMSPYETTLVRIADKLCGSAERKAIFSGLLRYRKEIQRIGFATGFQWLSGSFMEDIETLEKRHPGDVDVVTFAPRPLGVTDDAAMQTFINNNIHLFHPRLVKSVFHCDSYFVDLSLPASDIVERTRYWFGLFSHRRVTGLWKGMLQVPIAGSQDDADAYKLLGMAP